MSNVFLRRCNFKPYLSGKGPTFSLSMWETDKYDGRGRFYVKYRLTQKEEEKKTILFEGGDYSPSPGYAVDSDKSVRGLMGFLCLKPGDTDREYFDRYTKEQIIFALQHGERLEMEVIDRFGED